jgi:hypothetical protein
MADSPDKATGITTATSARNKSKPYGSKNSLKHDSYSEDDEAAAACYCGAVQSAFVS